MVKSTKTLYFSKEYHDFKLMFLCIQKLMLSYISMLKASNIGKASRASVQQDIRSNSSDYL